MFLVHHADHLLPLDLQCFASELKSDVSSTPRPLTVAVREFETPAYLRQGGIVYSQTPGEVGFYEYHVVERLAAYIAKTQPSQSSSSSSPLRLLVRNICRTYKDGPVRFDTT
jgi:hypothetical protein